MTRIERRETSAGGASISYLTAGGGPMMMFLHGLMANALDFRFQLEEFSGRHRCVAPDLPGFGMSRDFEADAPGLSPAADAVAALIEQTTPHGERITLVGHSFGSVIALELMHRVPDRIGRAALVGAPTDLSKKPLLRALVPLMPSFSFAINRFVIDFYSKNINISRKNLTPELELLIDERNALVAAEDADSMVAYIKSFRDWVLPWIPGDRGAPVLIVHGANDAVIDRGAAAELEKSIPNSRVRIIDNARHSPMYEQPDDFNRALAEFLNE